MNVRVMVGAAVVAMLLAAGAVQADVFNMGGTRNPTTGAWTGLASLDMVTVGNPGNAPDVNLDYNGNPLGSVGYTYQTGKYDVTAAQYCQFLNAVAAQSDPFGLYSTSMAGGPGSLACGITQTGSPGHYSYTTTTGGYAVNNGNFPVNCVSWGDAARFCNWLTNGQLSSPEGAGTTETGSYTLNGAVARGNLLQVTRNPSAKYVIPTENEWYKAAYYKGGSTNAGYWQYPTQSNTVPTNVLSATGTNNANYWDYYYNDGTGNGGYTDSTNYLTQVGAFAGSPGPYGTYDMGGDVFQWDEAIFMSDRELRGGCCLSYGALFLQAAHWGSYDPTGEGSNFGFRVFEVPEPATPSLLALGGLAMLKRRLGKYRRFSW